MGNFFTGVARGVLIIVVASIAMHEYRKYRKSH